MRRADSTSAGSVAAGARRGRSLNAGPRRRSRPPRRRGAGRRPRPGTPGCRARSTRRARVDRLALVAAPARCRPSARSAPLTAPAGAGQCHRGRRAPPSVACCQPPGPARPGPARPHRPRPRQSAAHRPRSCACAARWAAASGTGRDARRACRASAPAAACRRRAPSRQLKVGLQAISRPAAARPMVRGRSMGGAAVVTPRWRSTRAQSAA
jgi:hypothetical protein